MGDSHIQIYEAQLIRHLNYTKKYYGKQEKCNLFLAGLYKLTFCLQTVTRQT